MCIVEHTLGCSVLGVFPILIYFYYLKKMSATGGNNSFTSTPTFLQEISYLDFLFVVIVGWIVVVLLQRVIDNFTYRVLGLDDKSFYHTLIIAIVVTTILITFVFTFNGMLNNLVGNDTAGGFAPPKPAASIDPNGHITVS